MVHSEGWVNSVMLRILEVILLLLIIIVITSCASRWETLDGVIGQLCVGDQIKHASGLVIRGGGPK